MWDFLCDIDPIARWFDSTFGNWGCRVWWGFWILFFVGCLVGGALMAELASQLGTVEKR